MQVSQKKQKGVAAVEFALVLPIILLIVFSIIEFGVALYDKAVLTNAAREGARAGIVLRTPKYTLAEIEKVVQDYSKNHMLTFGTQNTPAVTVTSGLGGTFGQPLTVTATYSYSGLGLGQLLSAMTGPITLSSTAVMANE